MDEHIPMFQGYIPGVIIDGCIKYVAFEGGLVDDYLEAYCEGYDDAVHISELHAATHDALATIVPVDGKCDLVECQMVSWN